MGNVIEFPTPIVTEKFCVTCGVEVYRNVVKGECFSCVDEARNERRLARNMYTGDDMQGYRWRLSDCKNGPTRKEAKLFGLHLKVTGRLRRYYSLDGTLLYAYSYDTCIYTLAKDYAEGFDRDIFNMTKYSVTTRKHVAEIALELDVYNILTESWHSTSRLSLRERRVMVMVRVASDVDHLTFGGWAYEFINRSPSSALAYMASNITA